MKKYNEKLIKKSQELTNKSLDYSKKVRKLESNSELNKIVFFLGKVFCIIIIVVGIILLINKDDYAIIPIIIGILGFISNFITENRINKR